MDQALNFFHARKVSAPAKHIIIVLFNVIQDALIKPGSRTDSELTIRRKQAHARPGLSVKLAHARHLKSHKAAPTFIHLRPPDILLIKTITDQLLKRQIHPSSAIIFRYVPQDIGELQSHSQLNGFLAK